MNAVFLIALVTVATLASTQALSCFGCDSEDLRCTPLHLQNCKGGLTTDACGCCAVCAKVVGETCGGPWNVIGKCDCGLTCYKSEEVKQQMGEFNAFGKCIRRWDISHSKHKPMYTELNFQGAAAEDLAEGTFLCHNWVASRPS